MKQVIAARKEVLSLNKLNGFHWTKKHRYTKDWELEIYAALNGKLKPASEPMHITVTSYRKRILDEDNLVGGCKGIIDAMKRLQLIVDDSKKWIKIEYKQFTNPKTLYPLTVIEWQAC